MSKKTILTTSLCLALSFAVAESEPRTSLVVPNISPDEKVSMTINMDDKRFSISGGCNILVGAMEIRKNDIFVADTNQLASTLMACNEELETMSNRITQFLKNNPKMIHHEKSLYLVGTIEGEQNSVYMPVVLEKGKYKDLSAEQFEKIFIYVSNETAPCPNQPETQCLQIRENKTEDWKPFTGTIEGFNPESGIAYRLRLKSFNKDTDAQHWVLDMIVEQEIIK